MSFADVIRTPSPWMGRRRLPAFAVLAGVALASGVIYAFGLQSGSGRPVTPIAATTAIGLTGCSLLALGTRLRDGRTGLVFFHHLAVVLASGVIAAQLSRTSVLATLDVVAAGMLVMLSIGRIGCHLGGCCHGRPVHHGVVYRPRDFPFGAQGFAGIALAPVQLAESTAAALLAGFVGWRLVAGAATGSALATSLLGYGIVRILSEAWRGDRGRSGPAAVNSATITALGSAIIGLALLWATNPTGNPTGVTAIGATLLAGSVLYHFGARGHRLRADDLLLPVAMARNAARGIVPDGSIAARSGICFAVTRPSSQIIVSTHADPPLTSRDVSRLQRTLEAAVPGSRHDQPSVMVEQGAAPS